MPRREPLSLCLPCAVILVTLVGRAAAQSGPVERNFSFVHVSDSHVSPAYRMPATSADLRSFPCVRAIKDLGSMRLLPYGVQAPKPSFVIVTGDITEFSFPGVTWAVVDRYFGTLGVPAFLVPGNHDNTWVADPQEFRKRYGGLNYSFDFQGCHFVGLCSATLQDPVPSFGEEVIRFLRKDLAGTGPATPVFVFFHHPLTGREFCSSYDTGRVFDALRGSNVALILDGHGHSAVRHKYPGLDGIEGGSPFNKDRGKEGYNVVSVRNDDLYAVYNHCSNTTEPMVPLLEKRIPARSAYPAVSIVSPTQNQEFRNAGVPLSARIEGAGLPLRRAFYVLDDQDEVNLPLQGKEVRATLDAMGWTSGAHFIRVGFADTAGAVYTRSVAFFVEPAAESHRGRALWRYPLGGASKAAPRVTRGMVCVGANDGCFYALDATTGAVRWTFDAGGEILSTAAFWDDSVIFGTAGGNVYALTTTGTVKWTYRNDTAVFSSPVVDGQGVVYFGDNAARLTALRAGDGARLWANTDARFSVESTPFVREGRVYYGAWDGYLYCLDAKTGQSLWKRPGPRNQARVNTYYAPADNGPVVTADGEVFVCDRGQMAGKYAPDGTYRKTLSQDAWSVGVSEDGRALYLRGSKAPVKKVDLEGNDLWLSSVTAGRVPVSPLEKEGKVYVCTNDGHLWVLDAQTGATLWDYQVTPKLYVMSPVTVDNSIVYTTGMDGFVTAIAAPTPH